VELPFASRTATPPRSSADWDLRIRFTNRDRYHPGPNGQYCKARISRIGRRIPNHLRSRALRHALRSEPFQGIEDQAVLRRITKGVREFSIGLALIVCAPPLTATRWACSVSMLPYIKAMAAGLGSASRRKALLSVGK
jgi:hypothetical protein